MNFFRPIGIAGLAWRDAARGLTRRHMWPPLLALVGVELVLMAVLAWFYAPVLVSWARPLVSMLGGEPATHYPTHLYAMPGMFAQLSILTRAAVVPIVAGLLCIRFAELFSIFFDEAPYALSPIMILRLITVGIVTTALPLGVEALILGTLEPGAQPVSWLPALLTLLTILSIALFLYSVPAITLQNRGVLGATREALRAAGRSPVPTLLVISVSLAVLFPLTVLAPQSDLRALSLRPELSMGMVLLRIFLQALIVFLLVGACTRLYAPRRSRRR